MARAILLKDSPCLLQAEEDEGEGDEADEGMLDDEAAGVGEPSVRWAPPQIWTALPHDGPDHLGSCYNMPKDLHGLPHMWTASDMMALVNSGCG